MAKVDINKLQPDLFNASAQNVSFSLIAHLLADSELADNVGLDEEAMASLKSLNPDEFVLMIQQLSRDSLQITFDTSSLSPWFARAKEQRQREHLIVSLLRYGATNQQVMHWFGLTYRQVQLSRKANNCPAGPGKKRTLTDDEAGDFSAAWITASCRHAGQPYQDALACLDVADLKGCDVGLLEQLEVRKVS